MSGPSTSRAFAAITSAALPSAADDGDGDTDDSDDVAVGYLVVRASGASAARMAIDAPTVAAREPAQIQLVMRASLPKYVPARGVGLSGTFGGDSAVYRSRRGVERRLWQFTIILLVLFIVFSLAAFSRAASRMA